MANNNHVPADMMAASYWQHAPVSDMYRQTQVDDYAVPQAHHHAIPMPPRNPMQNGSGTAISTPASIDSSAVGGGAATLSAETLQEEDLDGLGPLAAPASGKPIRRRMRMITSCFECRRRKLGCDRTRPCRNCDKFGTKCVYLNSNLDSASQHRLTQIKEKVGSLERQLERDVAKGRTGVNGSSAANDQQNIVADEVDDEEERELQITPLTALDLTYDDYADNTDDLVDLGVRVGRMRITERIGGLNRPRISEELEAGLPDGVREYHAAVRAMGPDGIPDPSVLPEYLKPGDSYLAPLSGFFFGQAENSPTLHRLLPSHQLGYALIQRYFDAVHPIARCVHRPSFETMYSSFWDDVSQNIEPRASIQAIVFAAWFSAAVSTDDAFCRDLGYDRAQLVFHMKIGVERGLSQANFLSTTRFETLQAFIMYLLPLCRSEVSRAHSVLVGAAIRMAECMGLHRDGSTYGLSPLETEIRRMVWHQLCFLDIRTCEAQGPKPAIRREDYDTKLPLNCEQDELTPQTTVSPPPAEKWTAALLTIMRFEINEMMRIIWQDRRKVENQKITLTQMLERVENFRKKMLAKYGPMLNDRTPIQQYAKLVMQLLIYRLHVMVLHPYHSNTANPLPDKLSGLLVTSGVFIVELAIRLESNPAFQNWTWYCGAYHQYHVAMLLTAEVYYKPNHMLIDRIWPCLDWVFDVDPSLPRKEKAVRILSDMVQKTNIYMSLRKVRAPMGISKAVPDKYAVKESPPPAPNPQPPKNQSRASQPRSSQPHTPQSFTSQSHATPPQAIQHHHSQHPLQHHTTHHQPPHPHTTQPPATTLPYQQPPHPAGAPMGLSQAPEAVVSTAGLAVSMPPPQALPGQMNSMHPPQNMGMPVQMMPPPPPQQQQQQQQQQPPPAQNMVYHPPPQQMIYAGVTNGEVLWSLPPGPNSAGSPGNSSDAGSVATQQPPHQHAAGMAGPVPAGGIMESLDWNVLDELFETDPTTGQFAFNTFVDLGFGGFGQPGAW